MNDDKLYLVTGASGFVGGHLVQLLRARGARVRALVRNEQLAGPVRALGAEVVLGDLTQPSSLAGVMDGVHGVYHIAALFRQAGFPDSTFHTVNVLGTRALLALAEQAGVKRFVHCSTVGVLGHVANPPADESTPYNPGDIYQRTKMEGEQEALEWFRSERVRGVVVRPAMIYGPGDTRMLKLFKLIATGRFVMLGGGAVNVHFIDVRDLVRAFVLAMERAELNGEVYTIGGREALPLRDMVALIARTLGVRVPRWSIPVAPVHLAAELCERICIPLGIEPPLFHRRVDFFTKNRHFDCAKARRDLGFEPAQGVGEEVRDLVEWYRMHGYLPKARADRRAPADLPDFHLVDWSSKRLSIMVRRLDGSILSWNDGAAASYGYGREETIGAVSHDILKTEFPEPLERINTILRTHRRWEGELVHVRRDGSRMVVRSAWMLREAAGEAEPLVVEINVERERDDRSGGLAASTVAHAGGLGAAWQELLGVMGRGAVAR